MIYRCLLKNEQYGSAYTDPWWRILVRMLPLSDTQGITRYL